jgi:hypothetical protein
MDRRLDSIIGAKPCHILLHFFRLDAHKDSIAIAIAEDSRAVEPRESCVNRKPDLTPCTDPLALDDESSSRFGRVVKLPNLPEA